MNTNQHRVVTVNQLHCWVKAISAPGRDVEHAIRAMQEITRVVAEDPPTQSSLLATAIEHEAALYRRLRAWFDRGNAELRFKSIHGLEAVVPREKMSGVILEHALNEHFGKNQ